MAVHHPRCCPESPEGLGVLCLAGCKDMGNGEKVGQIIKLNRQGFFCKTYEAELIRGGLNNGSGAASTLFDFTIEDERLIPAVQSPNKILLNISVLL